MAVTRTVSLGRMLDGSRPVPLTLPEAASQSYVVGDLVYMVNGYVTECGSNPSAVLGIAKSAGNNTTAGLYNTDVLCITGNMLVDMQVHSATASSADIEAADRFKAYQIAVTSGMWYVDKDNTGTPRVRIIEFHEAVGTVNGRVRVQWHIAGLQLGGV